MARAYPKTICPSEAARALTPSELSSLEVQDWREAMDPVRKIAWRLRADGQLEILQRGVVLQGDIRMEDVKGPIRLRMVRQESQAGG